MMQWAFKVGTRGRLKKKQTNTITLLKKKKNTHTIISMCNFLSIAFLLCYETHRQDGVGDTVRAVPYPLSRGTLPNCSFHLRACLTTRTSAHSRDGLKVMRNCTAWGKTSVTDGSQ